MKLEKITENDQPVTKRWYDDACGTALALEIVGERWALLIMRELVFGPRRFSELKANLPGISANVLTQRLQGLEASGVLTRRTLPSPANVQVYGLTEWGLESQAMMRDLGRWAARSPRHDPYAFMSAASAMMSLQALVDPDRARDIDLTMAFRFPADAFVARARNGAIEVTRGESGDAAALFEGDTMQMRVTFYGKAPFGAAEGMTVTGDLDAARAFTGLFRLPEKVA
ncbi:transcriptional regulator [Sphingomonas spermidinifaciens]|uniref:Transcriptional regulator n=1 Tax=Sphingomonas spermidinifaciens TaxID=1141889 RepID=A0A2A4B9C4_9SPHN|nr:winged helix-turn-helix transcriptional regulator [Sphingomonas spermidinifaciens]PCD04552.1 transcriptional regulator [Sphingomonas spermidinifaciens]